MVAVPAAIAPAVIVPKSAAIAESWVTLIFAAVMVLAAISFAVIEPVTILAASILYELLFNNMKVASAVAFWQMAMSTFPAPIAVVAVVVT